MRLLVTGTEGQVARSLIERGPRFGVTVIAIGRPALELARPESVREALSAVDADVIVNAAAYTSVDQAEAEPELAEAVNGAGAGAVAAAAREKGIPIVHLSTDYVFDGTGVGPYRESDAVGPLGVYGRSKLSGERAVAAAQPDHATLRTAWVYSPFGRNFVRTMLRLAESRDEISVVADQHGSPTSALDIADGVIAVARNLIARPGAAELRGIFHMTGEGSTTWAGFAEAIFAAAAQFDGRRPRVRAITTAEYPPRAKRPANSRLDGSRLAAEHGVRLPPWHSSLETCIERLLRIPTPTGA
jgi:dTDP-4-dehydrorhamnose reductase